MQTTVRVPSATAARAGERHAVGEHLRPVVHAVQQMEVDIGVAHLGRVFRPKGAEGVTVR